MALRKEASQVSSFCMAMEGEMSLAPALACGARYCSHAAAAVSTGITPEDPEPWKSGSL